MAQSGKCALLVICAFTHGGTILADYGVGSTAACSPTPVEGPADGFSHEAQKKLLVLLAKTVLKHPLDLRELQSSVLTTLIANRDSDLTSAATPATQGHNACATALQKAGKNRELESLGEPHVHLWGALVTYVLEHSKSSEDEKQVLQQHLGDNEPKNLEETVFVAECKKCYDPKNIRFVFLHGPTS